MIAETIHHDPKFEFEEFEKYKDYWRTLFEEYNQEMSATIEEEGGKEERERVIVKYQEVRIFLSIHVCLNQSSKHFRSRVQNLKC